MAAPERPDRTLAIAPSWIEAHCVVPDGFRAGEPFHLYTFQLRYFGAFYLVRGDIEQDMRNPILGPAFRHRRGLIVDVQKKGKSPMSAAHALLEGDGPALFAGWAGRDDGYACSDHGCTCGWEYAYEPGEPMGMRWPTALIQLTAVAEDQTDNIYDAMRPMVQKGPLATRITHIGEEFTRLPNGGRIDTVTSSAQSRLGQRVTFVLQTEVGLYDKRNGMIKVADTQYRNVAGMGGRASLESNAWDPAQHSIAQREAELAGAIPGKPKKVDDVYVQFTRPPAGLSYTNKAERRKIHQVVYEPEVRRENGGHVDLDSIEAEAAAMAEHDPAQAARFFGNLLVAGGGRAFDPDRWITLAATRPHPVPKKALVTIGFDGSKRNDHTALIATEVASGYQWPLGIWRPEDHGGEIPAAAVTETLEQAMDTFDVVRVYADPPYWEDTVSAWAGRFGKDRVVEWWTGRRKAMAYAIRSWDEAQRTAALSHCPQSHPLCARFTEHVANAVKEDTGFRDDGGTLWIVSKETSSSPDKMDAVVAAVLSWEARNDAIAAGALNVEEDFVSAYADLTPDQIAERMLL